MLHHLNDMLAKREKVRKGRKGLKQSMGLEI
jgi:hypothetical protein